MTLTLNFPNLLLLQKPSNSPKPETLKPQLQNLPKLQRGAPVQGAAAVLGREASAQLQLWGWEPSSRV